MSVLLMPAPIGAPTRGRHGTTRNTKTRQPADRKEDQRRRRWRRRLVLGLTIRQQPAGSPIASIPRGMRTGSPLIVKRSTTKQNRRLFPGRVVPCVWRGLGIGKGLPASGRVQPTQGKIRKNCKVV